jgi:hypothetical protein
VKKWPIKIYINLAINEVKYTRDKAAQLTFAQAFSEGAAHDVFK